MTFNPQEFFVRFVRAMDEKDFATLESMVHSGFVADTPQSGERSRGFAGFKAQIDQYPDGGIQTRMEGVSTLVSPEGRWALTPAYTVVPLTGQTNFTMYMRVQYPDGRWWHIVGLLEIRDEKLYRMENYFAPELAAPLAESIATYQHG